VATGQNNLTTTAPPAVCLWLNTGFTRENLQNLERLSDPYVLKHMPVNRQNPKHNVKQDVILYLRTWASCLENEMLMEIKLPEFNQTLV
jgi:hypothetical protein